MEHEIKMPRLGVNDDHVTLASWLVQKGDWVDAGQAVAVIESSKETSEIVAEHEGIITLMADEFEDIDVGQPIAIIGEGIRPEIQRPQEPDGIRMTERARKAAKKNNIDTGLLPRKRLVREKDILSLIRHPHTLAGTRYNDVILYGGGGFSRIAIDILKVSHAYDVHGIVDMKYPGLQEVMGIPVIGGDQQLKGLYDSGYHKIFNGVGTNVGRYWRKEPYERLKAYGFEFPNIIHPRAILEPSVSLGEGNLICAGAIIGTGVQIGNDCVINAGAVISHDSIISDNCHIASGAVLAGIVGVGENTLVGQNVTVYSRVDIGRNVVIENGCNIFKDVPDDTIVHYSRG